MNDRHLLAGWWPRSLRSRLFLILFAGLAIAYGLSFSILFAERYMSAKAVMLGTLESDLATSIAVIDRLPANERADWVDLGRIGQQKSDAPRIRGNLLSEDLKRHRKRAGTKRSDEMASSHDRPQGSGGTMVRQRIGLRKSGLDVRFGSLADICAAKYDVGFTPNSDRESGPPQNAMSALPPRADMCGATTDVR